MIEGCAAAGVYLKCSGRSALDLSGAGRVKKLSDLVVFFLEINLLDFTHFVWRGSYRALIMLFKIEGQL